LGFQNFQHIFYIRTLINYDYDMNFLNTHWYILVFYPFESRKNSITIVLSSYFHILEARAWHLLSYTFFFINVFKCLLKHEIIQYYDEVKDLPLIIIKMKNIYEFNLLSLSLWIHSTKTYISFIGIFYHAFTFHVHIMLKTFISNLRQDYEFSWVIKSEMLMLPSKIKRPNPLNLK